MANYFGTDGVRGTANQHPMTAEFVLKLGMAAGIFAKQNRPKPRVVIGKDTRLSGYMIEPALVSGFTSVGMNVVLVGPVPTPAVALLTRSLRADIGVMISASHNPYQDNGIKLFGADGYKLSKDAEAKIEAIIDNGVETGMAEPEALGRAQRLDDARGRYVEFIKQTFPKDLRLDGLKIVFDGANGAAYAIGGEILWELGAEVIKIGVSPDGTNINRDCGSTHPEALCAAVKEHGAHLGIGVDGDADRVVMCDENGALLDGDQLLAMIATQWQKSGQLKGGHVVATQMSNMGLERYLSTLGVGLVRTDVGDRYVMEAMREKGYNLGGEQSGHLILSDYATTGDGLLASLQVLALLVDSGKRMSELAKLYTPMPQLLTNIRYAKGTNPLDSTNVQKAIDAASATLGNNGRVFIRKSGTEPLIRIMLEGEDEAQIKTLSQQLAEAMQSNAA